MPPFDLSVSAVDVTRQLCDVESVSGNEQAVADSIWQTLEGHEHLTLFRDGDAIVARTEFGRDSRVVIAGHIDTVPLNDNLPTRFETDDDGVEYLWGRGTVDMKAGSAVHLRLAVELTEPVVDVTWVWYDHEEVSDALNGLGRLARLHPHLLEADFAILGEPTRSEVEGGCNGNLRAEIRTFGARSHSARSWVGSNAIHAAAPILDRLAAYEAREVEVDGLVYREGLNAVGITGGVAGNVIPDECMVHVNYRFAPSRSADEAVARVRELFADFDVTIVDLAPGARPGLDAPLARQFLEAVGGEAKPKYGWTDVARFSALGVPAVNYGPGDPLLAHHDDERVPVQQILDNERGLRAWLTA
ncbi:succinyl-diaminopimelate desuccinylase [Frigoribacterium sp. PhB116]|uniref:succinyl-diaminopimelate desuccinylase n=1 Tax=Frigoribacterium sp. PhB116 TaxID=2485174 RepID=UPI00105D4A15|nr:succinyl-diaminopimelate desuccinylase [Frigoribacterium sp. PhB116]TDT64499.1 succinyldiaminopimelate desuccinylase [Frigoribacterium sp. PhB116]